MSNQRSTVLPTGGDAGSFRLIVLTNGTFCRLTGQSLTSLLGKPLARLAWVHEQGQPLVAGEGYPWERAQKSQAPSRVVLGSEQRSAVANFLGDQRADI